MLQKDLCIRSKTAKLNNESSYLFWHVMKGHVAYSPVTGDSIIRAVNWRNYKTYLGQAPFVIEAFLKSSVPLPPSCNWITMENNKFWAHTLYKYSLTSGFLMFFYLPPPKSVNTGKFLVGLICLLPLHHLLINNANQILIACGHITVTPAPYFMSSVPSAFYPLLHHGHWDGLQVVGPSDASTVVNEVCRRVNAVTSDLSSFIIPRKYVVKIMPAFSKR